ncbi:MAG TPA: RICIN domain-containing protein [Anaerohalosphaeraceae bacterium]|nr:RICIN domain-containing protein [Anaerohalosphaeraceae bacterium]
MNRTTICKRAAALIALCTMMPFCVYANTVYFNTSDAGQTKAITEWGADTAWPSVDNMRHNIAHMGVEEIDIIRLNFYIHEPPTSNGEIGADSKAKIDNQLSIAAMAGDKPLMLTPATGDGVDGWYKNGSEVRPDRWAAAIEATQAYINRPIYSVEPFNEPDYGWGQGTARNLYDILGRLQTSPQFNGTILAGASTLNSDQARWWYDQIESRVTMGTTHQLAGSTDSYVNFLQYVRTKGDVPFNPELHSLAEAIYGAEYGMEGGVWWGAVLRARGLFVRSCQGKRLGYAENRGNASAAAVYRAPDGQLYGFAGCFERQGWLTPYRFVCTDRDVYFNGVGPIREYTVNVTVGEDAYIDIDYDSAILPPLDGNRWKIVNRLSGKVMEVANAGTADGANIRTAADTDALHQKWDIVRNKDGYYKLFNANSGRTAEVENWATRDGANVRQWGKADNFLQHWFIEDAGDGYYYIRNAHSNKYMDAELGGNNIIQWDGHGGLNQQWRFVPANPPVSGRLTVHYEFEGSVRNNAGSNNGTAFGSPAYTAGRIGQAINLDGINDYVVLGAGAAGSDDITVAAWVNWNGGGVWQRIFDFGNDTTSYMFLSPLSGGNTLRFAITTNGNGSEQILDTEPLPVGQWVHVAVTLSGNTGVLYLNGEPKVAGQILLNPANFNPALNYIGKSQWPDPLFNGRIDDFRIYDYALSAAEIAALSQPPSFISDLLYNADGIEHREYDGQSLTEYVESPEDTSGLTFQKEDGPDWLNVAGDGTLSGIPLHSNVGENMFTVRVENRMGIFDIATMAINVMNTYSGTQGMEDLLGFAAQWLALNCGLCGGADLDGDANVTISDFAILAHNWLVEWDDLPLAVPL